MTDAPDLRSHFKHLHWRPMPHSMGVSVASDFADLPANDPVFGLYKNCGLWTMDEAAILYTIAERVRGKWADLGCHTGWTSLHQAAAGCHVIAVDNMLPVEAFYARFRENVAAFDNMVDDYAGTTAEFFAAMDKWEGRQQFRGVVIDADHTHPWPLKDAQNAVNHLEDEGVILFHDFIGRPVRAAVEYLMEQGFKARVYWTPHMVACCWRGGIEPPVAFGTSGINWQPVKESMRDFPFERCV